MIGSPKPAARADEVPDEPEQPATRVARSAGSVATWLVAPRTPFRAALAGRLHRFKRSSLRTEITLANPGSPMLPALLTLPAPAAALPPAIILFGRDERGQPHASRFAGDMAGEAEAAAGLMCLHHAIANTDALRDLAARLPAGRLFPSGRGFVPFVKAELYERLLAATVTADTPLPVRAVSKAADAPPPAGAGSGSKGSPDAPGGTPKAPGDWAGIKVGSTVLACQGPMEGWWEAVVVATKADDRFVLRWRDFPDEPEISRARADLGLMPPGSREGLG